MRKQLTLLLLALAAVAAISAIPPASASSCPPPQIQVNCGGGVTICCYKFQPCTCPAPVELAK